MSKYLVTQYGDEYGCSGGPLTEAEYLDRKANLKSNELIVDRSDLPSGSADFWFIDGDQVKCDDSEELSAKTKKNESDYYDLCYAYQLANIDVNLHDSMVESRDLVKSGGATESDLPMAKANWDWLTSLWAFYYTEKAKLMANDSYSSDFLGAVGDVPHNYLEVTSEREEVEGGQGA